MPAHPACPDPALHGNTKRHTLTAAGNAGAGRAPTGRLGSEVDPDRAVRAPALRSAPPLRDLDAPARLQDPVPRLRRVHHHQPLHRRPPGRQHLGTAVAMIGVLALAAALVRSAGGRTAVWGAVLSVSGLCFIQAVTGAA